MDVESRLYVALTIEWHVLELKFGATEMRA